MNRLPKLGVFCLLVFSFSSLIAQSTEQQDFPQLKIKITNIKKAEGVIRLAVYAPDQKFLGEEITLGVNQTVDQKEEVILLVDSLNLGTYAICVYHDEDGDGKLDTNFLGIPKEPYGFSNNSRGMFGPPKYKAASFEFSATQQMIEIKVK